ncbi:MAG: hypothetical protein WCX64_05280 [Candidatus Micrarchaeia archaeon]|jgi:hypothetical protein
MNKAILFGIIAVVALFAAGCVNLGGQPTATPQASVAPTASVAPGVTDAQVNVAIGDVDKALAEIDNVTNELSTINSQDVNASVTDAVG